LATLRHKGASERRRPAYSSRKPTEIDEKGVENVKNKQNICVIYKKPLPLHTLLKYKANTETR
ncbi:MAG: hypothetical protein SPG68_01095, partial [Prevotella sp.]|nr:hypothetical protein [Prevotella sp.]